MLFAKNTMKPAAVAYYPMTMVLNVNVCNCIHERANKISCILNLGYMPIMPIMYTCTGV